MNYKLFLPILLVFGLIAAGAPAPKDKKQTSDDSIYDLVMRKLANDPIVKGGALKIEVKDGVVTLRGVVEQEKQKARAEKLARKISGVKQVNNQLAIGPRVVR